MFTTLTILPWYTGIILAMALFFGMHHVSMLDLYGRDVANEDIANCEQIVTRVLLDKSNYTDSVAQSPYFAGIITASMVWVTYAWLRRLMPRRYLLSHTSIAVLMLVSETQYHAFTHLILAITIGLCAYNFFRAITLDPGTCPKPSSDGELKTVRTPRAGAVLEPI